MYTQCPECEVAFRVTVEVLKQAAGKVRCGGCGIAFNALEHLSEEKPKATVRSDPEPNLPELTPEEPGKLEADTRPKSISAKQSAALLKTLDQLAGEDIRIEDTGVEWRVIDDEDDGSEAKSANDEMRFDDNSPLPDDLDSEAKPAPEPEPGPEDEKADSPADAEEEQVDLAVGDPNDWEDLLADIDEPEIIDTEMLHTDIPPEELSRVGILDTEEEDETDVSPDIDSPLDMDTQFAIQAEAMGIDLSSINEALKDDDEEDGETTIDEDLIAAAFESEATTRSQNPEESEEPAEPEKPDEAEDFDFEIPEETAEEKILNMMIDEDLFAIAVEDDDGMTSTIVQEKISNNDDISSEKTKKEKKKKNPLVETIIMEGDSVHDERNKPAKPTGLGDLGFGKQKRKGPNIPLRGGRRDTDPKRYASIAAAIFLVLILVFQIIHNSREALATAPVFKNTIAPVYRLVGSPVTPAWDIKGWRFEATKGSTDENDRVLTIYSRVGNKSQQVLPYPLVHVSLTDRFEEIIGSRVLEPTEYLAENTDPRLTVQPGDTFNAVIVIDSPSAEATGFKLNVCYRLENWQLRCAIEDFK
jgi:predicted Zn finger-like uncharacterized protein